MADEKRPLEKFDPPTSLKLSLLWIALMFLYIYNDYFSLYTSGVIEDMSAGSMGPLGKATPGVMVGVSLLLAVPALMIFLSVVLPPRGSRALNIVLGLAYTAIEASTLIGSAPFYKITVCLELVLTGLIIRYAIWWPRGPLTSDSSCR